MVCACPLECGQAGAAVGPAWHRRPDR